VEETQDVRERVLGVVRVQYIGEGLVWPKGWAM